MVCLGFENLFGFTCLVAQYGHSCMSMILEFEQYFNKLRIF
jgi:hypothetical protein